MESRRTPVERAFELAKSGKFSSVDEIMRQMKAEGFSVTQITGGSLRKQLMALIRKAANAHQIP
jgi:pentatricopeptide repeat protein